MHAENRPNLKRLPCTCSLLGISGPRPHSDSLHAGSGRHATLAAASTRIPDDRCKLPAALSGGSLSSLAARQGTATPRQLADHFLIFLPSLPPVAQVMHHLCSAPPQWTSRPRFPRRQTSFMQCTAAGAEKMCSRRGRGNTWQTARRGRSCQATRFVRAGCRCKDIRRDSARPSLFRDAELPPVRGLKTSPHVCI